MELVTIYGIDRAGVVTRHPPGCCGRPHGLRDWSCVVPSCACHRRLVTVPDYQDRRNFERGRIGYPAACRVPALASGT